MGKIRCFLGFFALLFGLIFVGNALAAGYNCPNYRKYTSCNSGYYISECDGNAYRNGELMQSYDLTVGNSCIACPSGYDCTGGLVCPKRSTVTISYNLNGGSGTTPSATTCNYGQSCSLNNGYTTSFYRAGYVLAGWATTASGSPSWTITSTTDRTVYAIWTPCSGATWKAGSGTQARATCSSCPTQTSGWTRGTGTGWTSYTQCNQTRSATDASPYCYSGTLKQNAVSAVRWGGTTVSVALTAKAGAYVSGTTCSICSSGYQPVNGSTSTICTSCKTGYAATGGSTTYHDEESDCKTTCPAGKVVATADAQCTTPTGSWYSQEHTVSQGSTSGTNKRSCATGYATNTSAVQTYHDAENDCKITCEAGTVVVTARAQCTTPTGSWYSQEHTVSQGSTSGTQKQSCDTGYATNTSAVKTYHDAERDCTKTCQLFCTEPQQSTCPENSVSCTFDTTVYKSGTENQVDKTCNAARHMCPLEDVVCESGYDKEDLECNPHAYNVSYSCGTGTGNAPGGTSQLYNGTYQIAANTCSKPGYNFTGWSDGSGIRQPGQITWTYTKDIVFTAQWEPCANNPTTGQGTCGCGDNSYPNGSGCANCSVSCASVPTYNLGTYNVCESETDNECYRNCTTSDVANSTVVSGTVTKGGTRSCIATSCAEDFYLSGNGCAACVPNATCPGGGESFECNTGYHLSDDETSCEPDEYSITLKKNGGSGTINGSTGVNDAVQQCKHGELCNLPSSGITRNGYAFTGWGDSSACTSGVYQKVFTGAETLYACWSQQTTQCQSGKYYNGTDHVNCPSGSYCPGTGNANIGQAGCSVSCPSGADGSDTGATSASGCYKTCGGKTITGGTATVVSAKVYYSGSAYPACTYHVTCNEGYRATNQDTAAATCTPCEDGQVCPGGDGTDEPDDCPPGSYCEGGIEYDCPVGGTSDAGAGAITDCYRVCEPTLDIDNGQGISTGNKYYNGNAYPACTYRAECDENYVPQNSPSENPSCVWGDSDECPEDHYCPPDGSGPIACPDGGKADRGSTSVTQCYKIFIDYEKFLHGKADVKCNYQTSTKQYDYCNVIQPVKSCDAGYYYNSGMMCSSTESGYYSPDGDITQTACPVNPTGGGVASTENADSYTDCYMACEIDVPNSSSIAAENNTVYGISASAYAACSFAVTCNTGYTVANNNSAKPSCVANQYTITLDKNGGTGSVADSVQCTFDSGKCDLPATSGLTRPGYTVVGKWCSNANGGAPCYDAGTSVATNISSTGQNTTLYAVWTPNVYTVNLDHNDADVNGAPSVVYLKYATGWFSNADATAPIANMTTIPTKAGYQFAGYYSQASGGVQLIGTSGEFQTNENALAFTTTNPATIYARWSAGTTNCAPGTYYTGNGSECETCTANNYCPGGEFATDSGITEGLHACPVQGLSATGAAAITDCYKTKLEYNATHGDGTQTCSYNSDDSAYTAKCTDRVIDACDAGYWLADADAETPDCEPVGNGYYSGDETVERTACPNGGDTESDTSTMVQQCFKTGLPYEAIYGSGTQRCFYSSGDGADAVYQRDCDTKVINSCWGGYYLESPDDIDCSIVTKGYYSDPGDTDRYQCPAGGTTYEENAESIRRCNKDGQPYTDALHGAGERTCFYTSGEGDDAIYSSECENITMTSCDAGYYYDALQTTTDCVAVGLNYYSPAIDMTRHQCPDGGKTNGTTSAAASECYRADMACDVANGSGEQTCNYNESDSAYTLNCQTCNVTMCDEGYSQVGNECINCPAGSVCEDGQQNTCSELTGEQYPNSDAGTTDVAMCYRNCSMADNAAAMTGRDYYQAADTCEIARCQAGYTLDGGECVECPEGSFCDGSNPGEDIKSCADLGNGDWEFSLPGATDETGCYQKCEEYDIVNGTAIPISDKAFYPAECEYRGESDTGNPCEIIDGVCVETSCAGGYEMQDGVCVPCDREFALSYKDEGICQVASCVLGYHPNGDRCEEDIRECSIPDAIYAEQKWDYAKDAFGPCMVKECEYGYHIASNACVSDTQPCTVENGTGYKEWDTDANKWGECIATYCDPGYTNDPSETNERTKQCGECKNKYSVLGELAASSYVKGCEIAACMYQGELYNLENNECVPICPQEEYEDETGTMVWDNSRKKCVRTCKEGYTMWP